MRILTDNVVHNLINWDDLTEDEQSDYEDQENMYFFRHDDSCYCTGDMIKTKDNPWIGKLPKEYDGWQALHIDTTLVVKVVYGINDGVIVGVIVP